MSHEKDKPISAVEFAKMLNTSSFASMRTQRFNEEVMPRLVNIRIENLVLLLLHSLIKRVSKSKIPTNEQRFIRMKEAPHYLSMNKNFFNENIRPSLIEIPIGTQGIAFDRLDLERAADDYKKRVGRPGNSSLEE